MMLWNWCMMIKFTFVHDTYFILENDYCTFWLESNNDLLSWIYHAKKRLKFTYFHVLLYIADKTLYILAYYNIFIHTMH